MKLIRIVSFALRVAAQDASPWAPPGDEHLGARERQIVDHVEEARRGERS